MAYLVKRTATFLNFDSVDVYVNGSPVSPQTYDDATLYTVQKGNGVKVVAKGVDPSKKSRFNGLLFYFANTESPAPFTITSEGWSQSSQYDYEVEFTWPSDYNADTDMITDFAEAPTGPIPLSAACVYTTYPEIYVNDVRVYNQPQCNSGDTVEFRFRKLSGYTYSESFTLASEPLTIAGLVEGDYENGMHYLRFTADNSWSGKSLALTVDIVDKSSFKTINASAIYSGRTISGNASIVDSNRNLYNISNKLVPSGIKVRVSAGYSGLESGVAFDKINVSSVGITDSDIINKEWSYYSSNIGQYTSTAFIFFEMPNSDVTCVMDLKQVSVAEINYYNEGEKWSITNYGQIGDVLGNALNNGILRSHPNKQGYTWVGWCTDEQLTTLATENTEIPALGLNLYAKYSESAITHDVSFYNGSDLIKTVEVEDGSLFPTQELPDTPTRQGKEFYGWSSTSEYYTNFDFLNTRITADTNLYAFFNNIIDLQYNGGHVEGSQATHKNVPTDPDTGKLISEQIPTVVKSGYVLDYWVKDDITKYTPEELEDVVFDANEILTAQWGNIKHTVTFKEGDETIATVKVVEGYTVKAIEPEHTTDASGNEFIYWMDENNVEFDFSTPITEDITLTAYYVIGGNDKWVMALDNCYVGLADDIAYLPKARVLTGTKALAISATAGSEKAYIFYRPTLTWIELQHYSVNI